MMKDTIPLVLEKQFARILYPGQQALPLHYLKPLAGPTKVQTKSFF